MFGFTKRHEHEWRIRRLEENDKTMLSTCLLYTSPSPRDMRRSRMPSSA
ncbi:hypothetical protein JMUB7532_27400 [Staphylococcus aureus]